MRIVLGHLLHQVTIDQVQAVALGENACIDHGLILLERQSVQRRWDPGQVPGGLRRLWRYDRGHLATLTGLLGSGLESGNLLHFNI